MEFTGVRPADKLDEILWQPGGTVFAINNPDVVRVRERDLQPDVDIRLMADELLAAVASG